MFERFTDRARKVMRLANEVAGRFNHPVPDTRHILWGLLKEGSGVGVSVLRSLDVDVNALSVEIYNGFVPSEDHPVSTRRLDCAQEAQKLVEAAISQARQLGHNYIGSEHILLGMLALPQSQACRILGDRGVVIESARRTLRDLVGIVSEENRTSVQESVNALLFSINEELARLETAQEDAVKAAQYERAAELRDLRMAARDRMVQALSEILNDLEDSGSEER